MDYHVDVWKSCSNYHQRSFSGGSNKPWMAPEMVSLTKYIPLAYRKTVSYCCYTQCGSVKLSDLEGDLYATLDIIRHIHRVVANCLGLVSALCLSLSELTTCRHSTLLVHFYKVAQNKISHQTICNISATSGMILKVFEAA